MDFEKVYPRVLTWEGPELPLKHMRMKDANLEEVFRSGAGILLYTIPGQHTEEAISTLEQRAAEAGIAITEDTLFRAVDSGAMLIRFRNTDGWSRIRNISCGFEQHDPEILYTNDGMDRMHGGFQLRRGKAASGEYSIVLDQTHRKSPVYLLKNVQSGDWLSVSVKVSPVQRIGAGLISIHLDDGMSPGDAPGSRTVEKIEHVDPHWSQASYFGRIGETPSGGTCGVYVESRGEDPVCLDDLSIRLYRQQP
jgi:hypothetical protein